MIDVDGLKNTYGTTESDYIEAHSDQRGVSMIERGSSEIGSSKMGNGTSYQ